jgi:hypothetical protein
VTIYVGVLYYYTDASRSEATQAIDWIDAEFRAHYDASGSVHGPAIEVAFLVGSPTRDDVDFEGPRLGRFSRKRQLVQVRVGVPGARVLDPGVMDWLWAHVQAGVLLGVDRLNQAGIAYDRDGAEEVLLAIERDRLAAGSASKL